MRRWPPRVSTTAPYYAADEILARMQERAYFAPSGCVEWTGKRHRDGYGLLIVTSPDTAPGKYKQTQLYAHRLALWLRDGVYQSTTSVVCHVCDNPPCFNADHLYRGSIADNYRDRYVRHGNGDSFCDKRRKRKLSAEQVREARTLFFGPLGNSCQARNVRRRPYTAIFLAHKYGLSQLAMLKMLWGVSYSEIEMPSTWNGLRPPSVYASRVGLALQNQD